MAAVAACGSARSVPEPGAGSSTAASRRLPGSLLSTCTGTVASTTPAAPPTVSVAPGEPIAVRGAPASTESATPSTGVTESVPARVVRDTSSAAGPVSTARTVAGEPSASPTMLRPTPISGLV